jgi:hypothetical protein
LAEYFKASIVASSWVTGRLRQHWVWSDYKRAREKAKKLKNKGQEIGEAGENIRYRRSRVEGGGKDLFISALSATTLRS